MLLYTTTEAVTDYLVDGLTAPAEPELEKLIERAERDIDTLLGNWRVIERTERKLEPSKLLQFEQEALSRSVCAQTEWRLTVGEKRLVGMPEQRGSVIAQKGPDFDIRYSPVPTDVTPRRYGPKVAIEMQPIQHLRMMTGRART